MSSEINGSKTQIIVAVLALIGVLGGALLGNWDKLFPQNPGPSPNPTPVIPAPSPEPSPTKPDPESNGAASSTVINISGVWRDDNLGAMSQITQQGTAFTYRAWGMSCFGYFQSTGSGTIKGNFVESRYVSNFSQGTCSGTVTSDGRQMISNCNDSVCKQFSTTALRQ